MRWRCLAFGCVVAAVLVSNAAPPDSAPAPATAPADRGQAGSVPSPDELVPIPPCEPDEALRRCQIIPGFRLELAAHEPNVFSPVAAAFDEDGRLYVAEMIDYPFRPKRGEKPLGTVRLLEDRDSDGFFETSLVFADGLLWPTGVAPWKGGIFVAAAPDIWYFKDTDGDGRADEQRRIFTGFGTENEQGSVNNLCWGIDGKIYGTSSKNGGQIRAVENPGASTIEVRGHDFCFDPRTLQFELLSGNSQFGIAMDDWGNRFLCDQSNPCQHVVLPQRYLSRNPQLRVRDAVNDLAPGATPSFRLSPIEGWRAIRSSRRLESGERGADSSGLSHDVLDGVAGPAIYRGDAFLAEFRGQLFVGDAQSNLVHRRLLTPAGASFRSQRADQGTEFIRSSDNWFRPVNVINAPDGTLYVLDMCREVIESVHVPLDVFKKIDYTRGRDRGRIYRIVPDGFQRPRKPALSGFSTAALVSLLEHRGGWWRDTAQRLLLEREDPGAIDPLRRLLQTARQPQTKIHALHLLAGLKALSEADLTAMLGDSDSHVREHALRLAEPYLPTSTAMVERVLSLTDDPAAGVRFQAAFTLGEISGAADAETRAIAGLARIAARDGADPWFRAAIFSSSATWPDRLLRELIDRGTGTAVRPSVLAMLEPAAELVGRRADVDRAADCLNALAEHGAEAAPAVRDAVLVGIATGRREAGGSPSELSAGLSPAAAKMLAAALDEARTAAGDEAAPSATRTQALRMLSCGGFQDVEEVLARILASTAPEQLKRAALQTLAHYRQPEIAELILAPWSRYAPNVCEAALPVLLSRPEWTIALLDAIAAGKVAANQIGTTQRTTLLNHSHDEIARRARQLWNDAGSPRAEVIARYQPFLDKPAAPERGQKVYERECAACHQIGGRGHAVGPNLALARHRTAGELLIHILDPNREVQPAYVQYVLTDKNGGIFAGLIAADTPNSITLRQDRNVERTILKNEIEELAGTDKSLMAEGFEKTITPEEMADLIAYLMRIRYDLGTDPGHTEPDRQ